jgi:TatA/E family protein of Tat protein translocase
MFALTMPGFSEWLIIAAIGLLLFGKRLPEVGRSLGKGIVEFKKGLKGIEDDVTLDTPPAQRPALGSGQARFDPATGKPLAAPTQESIERQG